MGFLLGKIDAALTEFETTNQDIKFDSFLNSNRSINKTAQTYQYKEKGSFKYEFQYMQDAEYASMLKLIKDRNTLHQGMYLVPIPFSLSPTKSVLAPEFGTANQVWYALSNGEYSFPWKTKFDDLAKEELTEAEYGKVSVYDTNYIGLTATTGYRPYFLLQFDLSDFITEFGDDVLRRATLGICGMNCSPIRIFAWSPLLEDWYNITDVYQYDATAFDLSGAGAFSLNKSMTASLSLPYGCTNFADTFVDGNDSTIKFMMAGGLTEQNLILQHAKLFVNGYWVFQDGVQDIENYMTSFIGAGRMGNLELTEI